MNATSVDLFTTTPVCFAVLENSPIVRLNVDKLPNPMRKM